jgi:hypothetical protein
MHTHPKGSRAHVLLTSVFGPYARDDEFGSRAINPYISRTLPMLTMIEEIYAQAGAMQICY